MDRWRRRDFDCPVAALFVLALAHEHLGTGMLVGSARYRCDDCDRRHIAKNSCGKTRAQTPFTRMYEPVYTTIDCMPCVVVFQDIVPKAKTLMNISVGDVELKTSADTTLPRV